MLSELDEVEFVANASNIKTALHLIQTKKPDLVILDIQLEEDAPEENGINLLITLRRKYPNLIIAMLTSHNEPQYKNTCLAFGADYFLDKAQDIDQLPQIVSKLKINMNT